ncbi:MAG TPA: hypothetical protein VGH13_20475 [Xanthobacteraceae bacterium]|jgi:hypothetical protein
MTHNNDGSITLTPTDAQGLDVLIASMDRRTRTALIYTAEDAVQFVREWRAFRAALD